MAKTGRTKLLILALSCTAAAPVFAQDDNSQLSEFDRVKPTNPVGKGGTGALQANLRYDYLDLMDEGIVGGTHESLQTSLIWTFTDYTRLLLNDALLLYDDAAFATGTGETSYNVDVVGIRAQVDFLLTVLPAPIDRGRSISFSLS